MKSLKCIQSRLLLIMIVCVIALSHAQAARLFEPVIVKAYVLKSFTENQDVTMKSIVVYRYSAQNGTWTMIPFQVDQKAPGDNGKYILKQNPEDIFYQNDEIVFFLQDCGDKVDDPPQGTKRWINDLSSRNYWRNEVDVFDPLDGSHKYAYIFRTDTPEIHPFNSMKDYIGYNEVEDRVYSRYYQLTHNEAGLISKLIIPSIANGNGVDFLERLKIRARTEKIMGIPIKKWFTEMSIQNNGAPTVIDGKIRVFRRWNVKIGIAAGREAVSDFLVIFYPTWVDFGTESISLQGYATIDRARYSFDLEPASAGMKMFSSISAVWQEKYPDGVPIDNKDDTGLNNESGTGRYLKVDDWNWWMQTGAPGTLLTVSYITKIGYWQELYYKDGVGTNDESEDTGSNDSWGDTGAKFTGSGFPNELPFAARLYFLGSGVTPDSAWAIREMVAAPLISTYDSKAVPVELASFNIHAQKNQVILNWTTASETNNFGFAIERKTAHSDWQQIAFVKGAGTTQIAQTYAFRDDPGASGNISYRLNQMDLDGTTTYYTAKDISIAVPGQFTLAQNYPNPFNPSTTIDFEIPDEVTGDLTLSIYDLLGRRVRALVQQPASAGYFQVIWDGRDEQGNPCSTGIYFYTLRCNNFAVTKRMVKME